MVKTIEDDKKFMKKQADKQNLNQSYKLSNTQYATQRASQQRIERQNEIEEGQRRNQLEKQDVEDHIKMEKEARSKPGDKDYLLKQAQEKKDFDRKERLELTSKEFGINKQLVVDLDQRVERPELQKILLV